jgi:ankyrin repeat protein
LLFKNGNLDKIKELVQEYDDSWYENYYFDYASENGHLEVVKFLQSIGKECTTYAMNYASRNRYLEVLNFFTK